MSVQITFNDERKAAVISEYTIETLKKIAAKAGLSSLMITSTLRTPEAQANAMYHNLRKTGYQAQLDLYGPVGTAVLQAALAVETDITAANPDISPEELKEAVVRVMLDEIANQRPKRVSRHVVTPEDYAKLNVLDIGYGSVADKDAFRAALRDAEGQDILKFIDEPENGCFHVEIPQK